MARRCMAAVATALILAPSALPAKPVTEAKTDLALVNRMSWG